MKQLIKRLIKRLIRPDSIRNMYWYSRVQKSDINEHQKKLRHYASRCESVAEFGVRDVVSTWAFLRSKAKRIYSYDIEESAEISKCRDISRREGRDWTFFRQSTLEAVLPEDVDLLFVDTLHTYAQVRGELERHAPRVRKYIAFHDTSSYGEKGMNGEDGIMRAIQEFMRQNPQWQIVYRTDRNNGLLILEKSAS